MPTIKKAAKILEVLGVPQAQQNERSALTLLALANLGPKSKWNAVERPLLRTVDIMEFMRSRYGKDYKPNSRETIRRQTIHQFEQARIADRNPDDPSRATNSGLTVYQLTEDGARVVGVFGTPAFDKAIATFRVAAGIVLAPTQGEQDPIEDCRWHDTVFVAWRSQSASG